MKLVDEPRLQVLANGRDSTADAHVTIAGGILGARECRFDPLGHEMKVSPARHAQRRTRVMREHERRAVIDRLVAPPAFPALIGPGPAYRPEHVASQDP